MSIDITGGYNPDFEYPLQEKPTNPSMRDSVSFWVTDDEGRFGFPRMCIETVGAEWDNRGVEANIAFPDGRVFIGAGGYKPVAEKTVNGKVVSLNAGPLTFEVIEPFKKWKMTFDGLAYETTTSRQIAGEKSGPTSHIFIEIEANMVVPPWIQGEKKSGSGAVATDDALGAVGGHRNEQLFRCKGVFKINKEEQYVFNGTGLKIRRYGARDIGDFPGHAWQSAVFPSGKAFGWNTFPPRADGTPAYSEAYYFDGQNMRFGKVTNPKWMYEFIENGEEVGATIEMEDGEIINIGGTSHHSTFVAVGNPMFGDWKMGGNEILVKLPFHQGGALYTLDSESAFGMIERSLPLDKMKNGGKNA